MKRICEFVGWRHGRAAGRICIGVETVDAIVEEDEGCTIVTSHDTHRVTATYDEAQAAIWPAAATED